MKKYKHSEKFYDKAFDTYKKGVQKIGGVAMTKNAFKSAYDAFKQQGATQPVKELIYGSRYGTKYKTALAEYKMVKSLGIKATLKQLKELTTQDFAVNYAGELATAYADLTKKGKTGKEAKQIISQQWFGSK